MKRNRSGFTLLELIVVIIILGVLAAAIMPSMAKSVERTRSREGVQVLTALLGAQKRYELENGVYTTVLADLDIDIPAPDNFNAPTLANPGNETDPLASIQRNGAAPRDYTISISGDGTLGCAGAMCADLDL